MNLKRLFKMFEKQLFGYPDKQQALPKFRHSPKERNIYVSNLYVFPSFPWEPGCKCKELTPEQADSIFRIILANFVSQKDSNKYYAEYTYWHVEKFLSVFYGMLSEENKEYAKKFLDFFSHTEFCGPTFTKLILDGSLCYETPQKSKNIAAKRLAAALKAGMTPWHEFNDINIQYLIALLHNADEWGWREGSAQEENDKAALILCHSGLMASLYHCTADRLIQHFGLEYVERSVNDLLPPYFEKEYNRVMNDEKHPGHEEVCKLSLEDLIVSDNYWIVTCSWIEAIKDVCDTILGPSGEAKPYMDAMDEYVSDPTNYPDITGIDLDALIDQAEKEE